MTQTIQSSTSPAYVSKHCIDAVTDKAMQTFGGDLIKAKCDRLDWRREGNNRVLYAGCLYGEQPFKVYAVATGDLETHYKTTMTVTRIGKPEWPTMPPETVFNTSAKWIGVCLPGQRPGDMILANGQHMNIRDVPGVAALLPKPATAPAASPNATELPPRKPGLWDIATEFDNQALPVQRQRICLDAATDRATSMVASTAPGSKCMQSVERKGDGYLLAGKCTGGVTTLADATITGDFQQSLSAEIRVRREDGEPIAPGLPAELVARQTSRWISACPADTRPGDIIK